MLRKILHIKQYSRLGTHISEFGDQLDINNGCCRFQFENRHQMSVVLKTLGYVQDDNVLKTLSEDETILSRNLHNNYEILQETHAGRNGAYAVFDRIRGKFKRVGSSSVKFGHKNKGRIVTHIDMSKKRTE